MQFFKLAIFFVLIAMGLVGCGGGGGSSPGSATTTTTLASTTTTTLPAGSVTLHSTPTARFEATQNNAAALAAEIQGQVPSLVNLTTSQSVQSVIGAVNIISLPGGVGTLLDCSLAPFNGSGTASVSGEIANPSAGASYSVNFNNCSIVTPAETITFNGTFGMTFTTYVSATNYTSSLTYTNFSFSATGNSVFSYGPLNGSFVMSDTNGVITYTLPGGGQTNITLGDVTNVGSNVSISNADYVYDSVAADGIVSVVFSNWTYSSANGLPISGTITGSGANGNTVTITASASGYTVNYTINGVVSSFSVSYPSSP